ncbi:hypothetical protein FRB95_010365 [Tulasnella sp. JGI-2019a]|nr:hypothetical protein FRB95_010365 [Tulasnella sp. JGI-2019a]
MRVAVFTSLLPALAMAQASSTVSGATPAESGAVTPCISDCSTQGADAAGCSSFADLSCICTSDVFTSTAGACLQANCTAAEQQAAQSLDDSLCAPYVSATDSVSSTAAAASQSIVSSASAAIHNATSSAKAALSSVTSSIAASASAAAASATKTNAAGVAAQLPGLNVVTAVAGAFLATVIGPMALFA